MTLSELSRAFLAFYDAEVRAGRSQPATAAGYAHQLSKWIVDPLGDLPIEQLKPFHLVGLGGASWHRMQAGKRLTSWAAQMGLLDPDPFAKLRLPDQQPRERVLDQAELIRLYSVLSPNWRHFVLLMRHLACRPGELRGLRWRDVHLKLAAEPHYLPAVDPLFGFWDRWEERFVVLHEFKAKARRKDKLSERTIPLDPVAACLLWILKCKRNPLPEEPVFYSRRGDLLSNNAVRCAIRRARRRAGLEPEPGGERIVAYSLRHTAATELTDAGINQRTLGVIMGHTNPRTTQRYQHLKPGHLVDAIDRARMAGRARPARPKPPESQSA